MNDIVLDEPIDEVEEDRLAKETERCAVCGVGRWVTAHDPEAGPRYHPFTPEAR